MVIDAGRHGVSNVFNFAMDNEVRSVLLNSSVVTQNSYFAVHANAKSGQMFHGIESMRMLQ
jgi:hypothetical protein